MRVVSLKRCDVEAEMVAEAAGSRMTESELSL
jgi:hypothetical protein